MTYFELIIYVYFRGLGKKKSLKISYSVTEATFEPEINYIEEI